MTPLTHTIVRSIFVVAMCSTSASNAADVGSMTTTYQVSLLDSVCGLSYVRGINNDGVIYGSTPSGFGAICKDGALTVIGPGTSTTGVNRKGLASVNTSNKPWLYKNGVASELYTPNGRGYASGINNAGLVAGYSYGDLGVPTHAAVWLKSGTYVDLHRFGTNSNGNAVNSGGDVAGVTYLTESPWGLASVWKADTQVILGSFYVAPYGYSYATSINDKGSVVGLSGVYLGSEPERATLWKDGLLVDLAAWKNSSVESQARSINGKDQIVGFMKNTQGNRVASLWRNGRAFDLNTQIDGNDPLNGQILLDYANGINDSGQIVGQGRVGNNQTSTPFLLTPVQ